MDFVIILGNMIKLLHKVLMETAKFFYSKNWQEQPCLLMTEKTKPT